ncbi:MAG: GNAT family N-acetyltransferase [Nocardioides sp.]
MPRRGRATDIRHTGRHDGVPLAAGQHRVSLHTEPWNLASIATAERAGYLREGLLRSWMEVDAKRVDALVYAAVRPH